MSETYVQMKADLKDAMRARDAFKRDTLRLIIAELDNKKIELQGELTEEDILTVLSTSAKRRREAATAFREGDRAELADKEEAELVLIEDYLPKQLTDEEAAAIVTKVIAQTQATSKRDMGKVMGAVMPQFKGRYDGAKVKDLVLAQLD